MPIPRRQSEGGRSFLSGKQDPDFEVPEGVANRVIQEAKKEHKYGEHEVNKETYDFLKAIEAQIGEEEIFDIISRRNIQIENGGLVTFNCSCNSIAFLPELPKGLQELDCFENAIKSLPELPAGLKKLNCGNNQIKFLPELPSSLQILDCRNTQITSVPELPAGLRTLYCHDTEIELLPNVPEGLRTLYCDNTSLSRNPEENEKLKQYCKEYNIKLRI